MADNFFADIEEADSTAVGSAAPVSSANFFAEFDEPPQPAAPESGGLSGFLSDIGGAISSGYSAATAGKDYAEAVADESGTNPFSTDLPTIPSSVALSAGPLGLLAKTSIDLANADPLATPEEVAELRQKAAEAQARQQLYRDRLGKNSLSDYITRNVASVAANPESLGSTVGALVGGALGGPVGAGVGLVAGSVPAAEVAWEGAYTEAKDQFGANDEEAQAFAYAMTAIEFGTEAIGGKVGSSAISSLGLKKLTKDEAKSRLASVIRSRTGRALGAAASEAGEEVLATAGGDLLRAGIEATGALSTEEARTKLAEYNAEQTAGSLERYLDAVGSGVLGGGAVGTVAGNIAFAAEAGQQEAQTIDATLEGFEGERTGAQVVEQRAAADRAQTEQAATVERERLAAVAEAERQAAEEAALAEQVKADQVEADFRNQEIRNEAAANPDNVMAQAMASGVEWTPEAVAEERATGQAKELAAQQKAAQDEAARLERVEQGKNIEALRKTQESQKKAAEKAARDRRANEARSETQRRNEAAKAVLAENPDKSLEELEPLVRARMTTAPAAPTAVQEVATTAPAVTAPAAKPKATPKPGSIDATIQEATAALGLDKPLAQKAGSSTAATPYDPEAFQSTVKTAVRNLVRSNKQENADVQNLLRQQKLIMAPNPESIGRQTRTESTSGAEYDPETNKMYVYTDRIDVEQLPELMAAALHESTHGGQFNDRKGRPDIMRFMMGNEGYENANNRIKKAARDGNILAQEAVELARTAAGTNASVEELEIVPYLSTVVARHKGSAGRLGGVVADIKASTRGLARKLGMKNLEFDINELIAASQTTAGEVVATDMTEAREGSPLEMVVGRQHPRFQEMEEAGRTFVDRDGQAKFLTSDRDSELTFTRKNAADIQNGNPVRVGDVLNNPTINEGYPQLKNVPIVLEPSLDNGAAWQQEADGSNTLALSQAYLEKALSGETAELHDGILHELQHGVQGIEGFARGGSPTQFRTAEDKKLIAAHNGIVREHNRLSQLLSSGGLNNLDLTEEGKADIREARRQYSENNITPIEFAFDAAETLRSDPNAGRYEQTVAKELEDAMMTYVKSKKGIEEMQERTLADYFNLHGEQEAYFVQDNRLTREEDLPVQPEYPEGTEVRMELRTGQGNIPGPRTPLAMAANRNPQERQQSRVPTWLQGLFSSSQGTSRVIGEIAEFARSSPAAARMTAEGYMGKYRDELKTLARAKGVTPEALSDEISKKLDALGKKSDSYETNVANFVEAVKPYGRVGDVLINFRNSVDAMSLDIIKQRAAQAKAGKPLTDAERKTYGTILNNLGRYAHRQFAVNLRDAGDSYADAVWSAYEKSKPKGAKLSSKEKTNAQRASRAIDVLVDQITIPADLDEVDTDKINDLYDTWVVRDADALTTDEKRTELARIRDAVNGDKQAMTRQAETIAKEILGLIDDGGMISQYYRGGKQDRGILQERKRIGPEVRALMGEIKDPAMRLFTTAAKQAEFVARTKMLMELAELNDPYNIQSPRPSGSPEVVGMKQLRGEAFGPLQDYFVSPELFNLVSDQVESLANFEQAVAMAAQRPNKLTNTTVLKAIDVWGSVAGHAKMLQIVYKPVNFLYNFLGGGRLMLMNGNVNPANFTKAFGTAVNLITYARNPAKGSAEAKRLNSMGITDSAFIGEINSEQYRELNNVVKEMAGNKTLTDKMVPKGMQEFLRKSKLTIKESYAMMDVVYKIANFYQQVNVLTEYNKAAKAGWTAEEIDRKAADVVNFTNITYKRAAPIIKALERGGITQFGTYFYEVFRSEVNNLRRGFEEIAMAQNAPNQKAANVMRVQAARRISGQLLAWGLTAKTVQLAAQAAFGDDEEDQKWLRYLLPKYIRNQDFLKAGENAKGEDVFWEWSRLDPSGPATDIMRRIMQGDDSPGAIADEIFNLYIAPRIGTRIITAIAATAGVEQRAPGKPMAQQIFPEAYENALDAGRAVGLNSRATKAWTSVVETLVLPGAVDGLKDNNAIPEAKDAASTVANISRYAGGTFYKLDPKKAATSAGFDYDDVMKRSRKELSELVSDYKDLSPEVVTEVLANSKAKELEAMTELRNIYLGIKAAGHTDAEAKAILKSARIPKEVIPMIVSGEFKSRIVSKDSISQYKSREAQGLKGAEKKAVEKKWDEAFKLFEGADSQ